MRSLPGTGSALLVLSFSTVWVLSTVWVHWLLPGGLLFALWCCRSFASGCTLSAEKNGDSVALDDPVDVYADYSGCPPVEASLLRACYGDLEARLKCGGMRNPHSERGQAGGCLAGGGGRESSQCLDALREATLGYCRAGDDYVCIITSGATAGCALVGSNFPWGSRREFLYLVDNHTSVLGIQAFVSGGCRTVEKDNVDDGGWNREVPGVDGEENEKTKRRVRCVEIDELLGDACQGAVQETWRHGPEIRGLFAFPSESNFSGTRYSLDAVKYWQGLGYTVLVDAAKSCASRPPDLSKYRPEFVVLSYYKIFGMPTGLGALLVRKDALECLSQRSDTFFGGGTVDFLVPGRPEVMKKKKGVARFEHGTLPFLNVPNALVGFDWLRERFGAPDVIDANAVRVAKKLAHTLTQLVHANGSPVCIVYGKWADMLAEDLSFEEMRDLQGPVVTFNILDSRGRVIGCRDVEQAAYLQGICLRSGSLCNSGGLRLALKLTSDEMVDKWKTKRKGGGGQVEEVTCDDGIILEDGTPTGALRASFGYGSMIRDAEIISEFLRETFCSPKAETRGAQVKTFVRICRMYVYPIKSCRAQRVRIWQVDRHGMRYDRQWKIVDDMGVTLTVKRCPQLKDVWPMVDLGKGTLRIAFSGDNFEVPISRASSTECSSWLSKKLDVRCSLVERDQCGRNFSNQSHTLLLYTPSIGLIHDRSGMSCSPEEFEMRLRPNIVLAPTREPTGQDLDHRNSEGQTTITCPFMEDRWTDLSCVSNRDIHACAVKSCSRCDRVCIDPETGHSCVSQEPLRSIAAAKKGRDTFMTLGVLFQFAPCDISEGLVLLTHSYQI
jgi:molybdenum cofactor sulfurtransferase